MANAAVNLVRLSTRIFIMWLFILLLTDYTCAMKFGGSSHGGYSHSTHGGSHHYPSSTGLSGTHTSSGHSYSGNNVQHGTGHTYPYSTSMSGNNNAQNQHHYVGNYGHKTEVHHHYHYTPPQRVSYGSVSYPVYHSQPPVYVYEYRNSGSRFDTLLTGLALYNLGRMSSNNHHHYNEHRNYVGTPGEMCKLGIYRSNGNYEETRIDCKLMSSFIWDSEIRNNPEGVPKNNVSTSVVNVTQVHTVTGGSGGNNSVSTVTVTNTTIVDALEAKGKSIEVTPTMTCYIIRIYPDVSFLRKEIPCSVLQSYTLKSFRYNSAKRIVSIMSFVIMCQLLLFKMF